MDIISLYYYSELAKDLHMTRTANRLFVSQQTLSNHIQRLENQLGVKLLHRKPSLSLTYAGEKVLAFANMVNREYSNLEGVLSDVEQETRGVIHFGASSIRMNSCLPDILPEFMSQYPKVELHLTDAISTQLEPMVLDGKLDFALILADESNAELSYQHLIYDQIYLCVPDPLLKEYFGEGSEEIKERAFAGVNITDFACLPFCFQENRLGKKLVELFEEEGVSPNIRLTTASNRIATSLCCRGIAACIATQMCLIDCFRKIPDNMNIFPVHYKSQPLREQLVLVSCKDRYIPRYSKLFLELLIRRFEKMERIHLAQKAVQYKTFDLFATDFPHNESPKQ